MKRRLPEQSIGDDMTNEETNENRFNLAKMTRKEIQDLKRQLGFPVRSADILNNPPTARVNITEFLAKLQTDMISDLSSLISMFSYEGFSPSYVHNRMMSCEPNEEVFAEDLCDMIIIYLTRGTNITKILKRTSEQGVARITRLIEKYKIVPRAVGSSKSLTLARVSNTYPQLTSSILSRNPSIAERYDTDLPANLCFPGAASLLDEDTFRRLRSKIIKWNRGLSARIKGTMDVEPFVDASFRSTAVPSSMRINIK